MSLLLGEMLCWTLSWSLKSGIKTPCFVCLQSLVASGLLREGCGGMSGEQTLLSSLG